MAIFTITNTYSGHSFGEYEAADEDGALDALAREAGYHDYAAACKDVPTLEDELLVESVNT